MTESAFLRFFRIVMADPPTVDDFKSHAARGKLRPPSIPMHRGDDVPVYETEEQAQGLVLDLRKRGRNLGSFVAELHIPDDGQITDERYSPPGHHGLHGDPERLLAFVVSVRPI
ncbi:MAG TPA: hypothetical protein VH482_14220 [Thermomicrobiales bacterium]|jgi:hypothetical protein